MLRPPPRLNAQGRLVAVPLTLPFSSVAMRVGPVLAGPVQSCSALRGVSLLCVVLGGGVFRGIKSSASSSSEVREQGVTPRAYGDAPARADSAQQVGQRLGDPGGDLEVDHVRQASLRYWSTIMLSV